MGKSRISKLSKTYESVDEEGILKSDFILGCINQLWDIFERIESGEKEEDVWKDYGYVLKASKGGG